LEKGNEGTSKTKRCASNPNAIERKRNKEVREQAKPKGVRQTLMLSGGRETRK
jgi:hypothetical protein